MSVVFALATPPSKSAICVFRVSGRGSLEALSLFFKNPPKDPNYFYVKDFIYKGSVVDRVGIIFFKSPKSYTGEDSFEIHGHGGLGVMGVLTKAFLEAGFEARVGGSKPEDFQLSLVAFKRKRSAEELKEIAAPFLPWFEF